MKLRILLSATALTSASFILPTAAWAAEPAAPVAAATALQAVAVAPADEANVDADQTIVVTGSRIRRPNDESTSPITTVTADDIFSTGRISVGDILNDLPQLRSSLGSQNSTGGLGTRGLNFLDLRGLGRQRTLVLVNGRRQVSSDIVNGAFGSSGTAVDINTFPTDLIERIDIVTGGGSSIYGSDAIAGVVNFILKRNYDGLQVRGQAGVSTYGDAGNQLISVVAGKNFADGRGNIAVNLEYARQDDYYGSGRPLRQNDAFLIVDTDPAGSINGADDVVDRRFFRDIRSSTISNGGQVGIRQPVAGARCGIDPVGASYTCGYLFQADGSLVSQTGTRVATGPNGSYLGGNGYSSREGQLLVLSPALNRYGANLIGHFEISPALVPFIEAKFVRTEAFGSQSGPFFSQGQTLSDGFAVAGFNDRSYATGTAGNVNREGLRLDNPYLSASARATLREQITASLTAGINPNTGGAITGTNQALALAQVTDGSFRFSNRKNYEEFGIRDEQIRRDTYRIVGGVRGDFNDDWNYEVSVNYSEHKENNVITGNVDRQRFLLANDTTTNTAGQIVCRSQVDARYAGTDRAGNPARLAADIAACQPLNPFGLGASSQAARNYILLNSTATGRATQLVVNGFVAGDSSQLFELPGGPVRFSLGGEYRRETLSYGIQDPATAAGYAFYNALSPFSSQPFEVKEAFGEISVPLVKDVPLLRELTLEGSGRVANYRGSVGTVYAYSGGVNWRPINDLRIRGTYSRSVRSPYLGELFAAQSQNFTPAPADPCSERNIGTGSATRAANCTAAGRPAGYDFVYTSSLEIRGGGNPTLTAETSDSFTIGGVYQPKFLPGLSVSVDYYNVRVNQVITGVAAQTILNLCYDSPTLANPFCGLFQRAGASGGPRGEQAFRILESSLLVSSANFAKFVSRGVDTNISYNRRFGWGEFNLAGVWTHTLQRSNFTDPTTPSFENVILGELGDPIDNFNVNGDIRIGKVSLGGQLRWIGPQYLNTYEDYNALNGQPPQNADYAEIRQYPVVTYVDLRLNYDVNKKFSFNMGVTNLGNALPPYGLTGVGAGSGIYDNRGRYMFAGFVARL